MRLRHLLAVAFLGACEPPPPATLPPPAPTPAPASSATPMVRPVAAGIRTGRVGPSQESLAARAAYLRLERRVLIEGGFRRDGGGIDTRYSAADLARNFERIAFRSELNFDGGGFARSTGDRAEGLTRWEGPVRIQMHFGESVAPETRRAELIKVDAYARRLARVTGHPISVVVDRGNFHVFLSDIDEQRALEPRLRQVLTPDRVRRALSLASSGQDTYCSVLTWPSLDRAFANGASVAFVRTELPDLSRQACYHEEIAQGLGLGNDSDLARPSIFNDDDEFALLTTHDEHLLRILYDPRLRPGMSAAEARPVVRRIARELIRSDPT